MVDIQATKRYQSDMTTYELIIPGKAVAKGRPRFSRKTGVAFTPQTTILAENWAKTCCLDQIGTPRLEGPLAVRMVVSVEIARSWSKKKQALALEGSLMPTGKPDLDNVAKLYLDALNGMMWMDDSQIVLFSMEKKYAAAPQVHLKVTEILIA